MVDDALVAEQIEAACFGESHQRILAAEDLRLHGDLRVLTVDQAILAVQRLLPSASEAADPQVAATLFWLVEELMVTYALCAPALVDFPDRFESEPDLIRPFLRLIRVEGRRSWLPIVEKLAGGDDVEIAMLAAEVAATLSA